MNLNAAGICAKVTFITTTPVASTVPGESTTPAGTGVPEDSTTPAGTTPSVPEECDGCAKLDEISAKLDTILAKLG